MSPSSTGIAATGFGRRRSSILIEPSADYSRPIALRNPIVFYEGHLPAFSVIAFLRRGLGRPPVDARLEQLFARGIDPETEASAVPRSGASTVWPSRDEVRAFARACDEAVLSALAHDDLPVEGLYTALEHEAMHQETLLYMWHRLPYDQKRRRGQTPIGSGHSVTSRSAGPDLLPPSSPLSLTTCGQTPIRIPGGIATVGAQRDDTTFGWDNEFDGHRVTVTAFDLDPVPVTNADFLAFVEAGGYRTQSWWDDEGWAWIQQDRVEHPAFWVRRDDEWFWRSLFQEVPLPPTWPVFVSQAEASAYARWKGRRLMTEPEFHRAAYGTPSGDERSQPWGEAPPDASRGLFDFAAFDPVPVGLFPAGASAWGVHDLRGRWMGVDVNRLRPVPRVPRDGVVSRVLRRVLRRSAFRDERRLGSDRTRADSTELQELVQGQLPVRLREFCTAR